jgi:hypothetical protein
LIKKISQFEEDNTTVEFANTTNFYPPHTLKLAFGFYDWPFMELTNSLEIVIDSAVSGNTMTQKNTCSKESQDESGGLLWLMVIIDDVSLYPKFLGRTNFFFFFLIVFMYGEFIPKAVLDGRARNISYILNSNNSISVTLPHFWDSAGFILLPLINFLITFFFVRN